MILVILEVNEEDHNMTFKATGNCDAEHRTSDNDFGDFSLLEQKNK